MYVTLVPISHHNETPRCPTCGSAEHLWDDNLYEGCHRCGYLGGGSSIVRHGSMEEADKFDEKQKLKE